MTTKNPNRILTSALAHTPHRGTTTKKSPAKTYLSDRVLESVLNELAEAKSDIAGSSSLPAPMPAFEAEEKPNQNHPDRGLNQLLGQLKESVGNHFEGQSTSITTPKPGPKPRSRYLIFKLAKWQLAIPLDHVMEVGKVPQITWIPQVPEWIKGVTHIRGEIYTLVDTNAIFQWTTDAQPDSKQMILTRTSSDDMRTVLIVDRVLGIRNLAEPETSKIKPSLSPILDPFVKGISEWENQALIFFDLDPFLNSSKLHPWREMATASS